MAHELIGKISDETFSSTTSKGVVLVDFYADWCGPCKMLTPILDSLAETFKDKVSFVKLDVDSSPKITNSFQITSVPTLILFKDGKEMQRFIGLKDFETFRKNIQQAL
jgi:thioredoxin 1